MKILYNALLFLLISIPFTFTQAQQISKEELVFLTPEWKGERFSDGRPKVSDDILIRMKAVSIEEAWATMGGVQFNYQLAESWPVRINPDSLLVGRAFTTTFMPYRPDMWKVIDERGKKEGRRKYLPEQ